MFTKRLTNNVKTTPIGARSFMRAVFVLCSELVKQDVLETGSTSPAAGVENL
ncbi:hypothetical protein [Roseovarius sp. A46]|uniref:hypothetical protein n=1 Tax=Roseovarius sp. A46 TaxID=2109331 RepID=UPI0013E95748|nr:hypothetical protein [Roseovarius sp. A46]